MNCLHIVALICLLFGRTVLCAQYSRGFGMYRKTKWDGPECERPCFHVMSQMAEAMDSPRGITEEMCEDIVSNQFAGKGWCHRLVNRAVMDVKLIARLIRYRESGWDFLKHKAIESFCSSFCNRK